MEATPKRTRLSYKDKAAIVEAAKKGGGKEAMREKMMSEYKISRTAYYSIFRDFEPKFGLMPSHAKSYIDHSYHISTIRELKLTKNGEIMDFSMLISHISAILHYILRQDSCPYDIIDQKSKNLYCYSNILVSLHKNAWFDGILLLLR